MNLQGNGHFEETEKSVHSAAWTLSQAHRFCVCGALHTNLSLEQGQQAQTLLQEGSAHIQARTKLEMRPQDLRGKIYGQSSTQQQYCKAKNHSPKGRYSRCHQWKHRREREYSSIAERWELDPVCRESLRYEGGTRKDCEGILTPNPIQHTTAQRPMAKLFGAAGRWQMSTNRDAPQMSNRAQNALQPLS